MSSMRKKPFIVDLTKIEGEGEFPCPKCGTMISPDDESETVYTIQETFMGEDDQPESMIIQCNKCKSDISLEGLNVISDEEEPLRAVVSEILPESKPNYRAIHNISLDGQHIGQIVVEYAQEEDVKGFKKIRTLKVGEPFKVAITIIKIGKELRNEDHKEIVKATKRKIKNLKDKDIYIIENREKGRQIIKATNL